MSWRVAHALESFIHQANVAWPKRSRTADGTIGDTSHASRLSGHNPNAKGVVRAFDLTHDPSGGPDCNVVAEQMRAGKDRRVEYLIWNRRIFDGPRGTKPFVWRAYTGTDPHTGHIHLSVGTDTHPYEGAGGDPHIYDDPAPWQLPVFGLGDDVITDADKDDIADRVLHKVFGTANFSPSGDTKGPFTYRDTILRGISNAAAQIGPVLQQIVAALARIEKKIGS